ncbi:uncharacterized protein LOC142334747 [Convolutriloba macropyga]|uniref:uncharacterized protein LOC142334747 n=1 Tax=Convolutriloba macropyga TaxID=536237 RepID=UPI003F522FF5
MTSSGASSSFGGGMGPGGDSHFDFTIEDVRKQLNILGYTSVPDSKLSEFAEDLRKLIEYDQRKSKSADVSQDHNQSTTSSKTLSDDSSTTLNNSQLSANPDVKGFRSKNSNIDKALESHVMTTAERLNDITPLRELNQQLQNSSQSKDRMRGAPVIGSVPNGVGGRRMKRVTASSRKSSSSHTGEESYLDMSSSVDCGGSDQSDLEQWKLYQRGLSAVSECKRPNQYYKPPSSARPDLYPQRPSHDENGAYNMHLPRSFIRSVPASSAHPSSASSIKSSTRARSSDHRHSQSGHPTNAGGERKSDPVSKYTAYNEAWKEKKAPGEQNRNQLRWKIREQMAVSEEVRKKRNNRPPTNVNQYVVPTDKKRQDLRWEVRCNLAAHKPGSRNTQYY